MHFWNGLERESSEAKRMLTYSYPNCAGEPMNNITVDTNPLVYIYHSVPELGRSYASILGELSIKNTLLIPKIVYGELSLIFQKVNELNAFLKDTGIVIGEMTPKAYIKAANRWQEYNRNRVLMCQRCGMRLGKLSCDKCKSEIKIRQHILTDFIIGALALETKEQSLVTHDSGYFSTYFPELKIISSHQ